jgi:hypothetical protein
VRFMINKETFKKEHLDLLRKNTKKDPILIEKMVYAFGLLEILSLTEISFVFKGGTSLLLLLQQPKRFSTDIDILVSNNPILDLMLTKLTDLEPFVRFEEHIRKKDRTQLEKRHFKFYYNSPLLKREAPILLDVVLQEYTYPLVRKLEIENDFLIVESPPTLVNVPTNECLLGDKLTAFAPRTTGILFGKDKSLEIIKQFYDIGVLYERSEDYDLVVRTYGSVVKAEMNYRSLTCNIKDVLNDSFLSALTLCSRGKLGYTNEYSEFEKGIQRIEGHIFFDRFTMEKAVLHACEILYIYARILNDKSIDKIHDFESYEKLIILNPQYNVLNRIKKISLVKFAYVYEAIKSFE